MYKFAIIGTLNIDGKNHKAGAKGLIVESKELAERIKAVIGSGYTELPSEKPEKPKRSREKPEKPKLPRKKVRPEPSEE